MKSSIIILLVSLFVSGCYTPEYFVQKGNYDRAFEGYSSKLQAQPRNKKTKKDLMGLESTFVLAQRRDSAELALLQVSNAMEHWPRINALHRQIQTRQKKIAELTPLRSRKGYVPQFSILANIDSLQKDSRRQAATYLYQHAKNLLALTDSTEQREPAREAYYALRDLKTNYFPYWENANALIDSAYKAGKAHIIFETSVENGVSDGKEFWKSASLTPSFVKSEWLIFYKDTMTRKAFDYRAKCKLVSLHVGSESTSSTERTETKQVEDGYDEVLDTAGRVVSRTVKYKTETTTITTWRASRSANGTVLMELVDEHTGAVLATNSLTGSHSFDESSETSAPSAPSYYSMVNYVVAGVEGDLRRQLKKLLLPPLNPR